MKIIEYVWLAFLTSIELYRQRHEEMFKVTLTSSCQHDEKPNRRPKMTLYAHQEVTQ